MRDPRNVIRGSWFLLKSKYGDQDPVVKKPPQFPGEAFYAFVFSSSAAFPSRLRSFQISHETVFEGNEMISWFT